MTQTIGQKLKQARQAQDLTLEKAAEATRIRAPYLQALEADDLSAVPSHVQARGFLRRNARTLAPERERKHDTGEQHNVTHRHDDERVLRKRPRRVLALRLIFRGSRIDAGIRLGADRIDIGIG